MPLLTVKKELAAVVSKLQNDGLKWERTSSWNAGFDFGGIETTHHWIVRIL